MNIEELRAYCLAKPGAEETFPFDETTLVFKVAGKMFATTGLERVPFSINVKGDPEEIIEQREKYSAVTPGYHMNKRHWNTVVVDGSVKDSLVRQWVDNSYGLVASSLTKAQKKLLE